MSKAWESYELAAQAIIERFKKEFGLSLVEGKQRVEGKETGTQWEVDAKGVIEGEEAFVLIECRRYKTKKQTQEQAAAIAYRVRDTGSSGGIIVSPMGLQSGAKKVANANKIIEVKLHENSSPEIFMVEFLGKVIHGFSGHVKSAPAKVCGIGHVTLKCSVCGDSYIKYDNSTTCEKCNA
jgi:hypothetical protein